VVIDDDNIINIIPSTKTILVPGSTYFKSSHNLFRHDLFFQMLGSLQKNNQEYLG
jgi:hypothetical protein